MAEGGGYDNPRFDPVPNGEEAEGEEIPMRTFRSEEEAHLLPRRRDEEEVTSFGGGSARERLQAMEKGEWGEAADFVKERYPNAKFGKKGILVRTNEFGEATVGLDRKNAVFRPLLGPDGEFNPDIIGDLRKRLGKPASEIVLEKEQQRERNQEEISRLRDGTPTEDNERRIEELEEENERLEEENEAIEERLPLRERVKLVFKKYGLTVTGILIATGTIIGVIVSNLKSGLSKVAKGVGDGLKDISKKLAGILPGMIGSIVSFLFKAAGEAIGFLAKHAWLLILLVVTFAVEQLKER